MSSAAILVLTSTVSYETLVETRVRPVIAKFSLSPMFSSVDFSKPQSIGAGNILLCIRTSFFTLFQWLYQGHSLIFQEFRQVDCRFYYPRVGLILIQIAKLP